MTAQKSVVDVRRDSQILGALFGGDTTDDILSDYPSLSFEDLSAVQSLNANLQKELDRLYEIGELSEDTMDELVKMHLRTPYSPMRFVQTSPPAD